MITVDCLRSDRITLLKKTLLTLRGIGYLIIANGIAQSSATNGSFPSLMASRYFTLFYDEDGKIPSSRDTLPSLLKQHGYNTGAFISSNPWLTKWKDEFDEFYNGNLTHCKSDKEIAREAMLGATIGRKLTYIFNVLGVKRRHDDGYAVNKHAINWLDSIEPPFFLWLHFMEPHAPYIPDPKYRILSIPKTMNTLVSFNKFKLSVPMNSNALRSLTNIELLYDACVRTADDRISYFIHSLFKRVDKRNTLLIITADHGEEFHHGVLGHVQLYDETIKVPIIISNDMFLKRLTSIPGQLPLLDLAPTILDFLDLEIPHGFEGKSILSERQDSDSSPAFSFNFSPGMNWKLMSLRTTKHKVIVVEKENGQVTEHGFNLISDPLEIHPYPIQKEELKRKLALLRQKSREIGFHRKFFLSCKHDELQQTLVIERLRELGYI